MSCRLLPPSPHFWAVALCVAGYLAAPAEAFGQG